jgi:hypothetical protein
MQHNDPQIIDHILKQVEAGNLFRHINKEEHMEELLLVEKALGTDRNEFLEDMERDKNILQALDKKP